MGTVQTCCKNQHDQERISLTSGAVRCYDGEAFEMSDREFA